jgi:hypothetical protein
MLRIASFVMWCNVIRSEEKVKLQVKLKLALCYEDVWRCREV